MNKTHVIEDIPENLDGIRKLILESDLVHPVIQAEAYLYLFIIVALLGSGTNGFLLLVYARWRTLHTPGNVYVVNLFIGNFLNSVTLMPLVYMPQASKVWTHGRSVCKLFNGFTGTNVYCSTLSIMAISVNRYNFVKNNPGCSHAIAQSSRPQVCICLLLWLCSAFLVSPIVWYSELKELTFNISGIHKLLNIQNPDLLLLGYTCSLRVPRPMMIAITTTQTAFLLPIPLAVMCFYTYQLRRVIDPQKRAMSGAIRTVRAKRGQSVTILLAAMIVMYAALWLPFHVMTILFDFKIEKETDATSAYFSAFQLIGYTSLFANPLLYGLMNKNFKQCISQMLRTQPNSPSTNQLNHHKSKSKVTTTHFIFEQTV